MPRYRSEEEKNAKPVKTGFGQNGITLISSTSVSTPGWMVQKEIST